MSTKFNPETHWLDYAEIHARNGVKHLNDLLGVNFDDLCAAHTRLLVLYREHTSRGRLITKKDGEDFNLMCSMASILINVPDVIGRLNMDWNEDFSLALMQADIPGTIVRHRYVQNYHSPKFAAILPQDSEDWVSYEAFRLFLEHTGTANVDSSN
jgi:hypothetical protein